MDRLLVEQEISPAVTVDIRGGDLDEVGGQAGDDRYRRLEGAVAVAEDKQVAGGGKVGIAVV